MFDKALNLSLISNKNFDVKNFFQIQNNHFYPFINAWYWMQFS